MKPSKVSVKVGGKTLVQGRDFTVSRKGGKKYYVRVCTYKKVGGKYYYSSWSKARAVKTKKQYELARSRAKYLK